MEKQEHALVKSLKYFIVYVLHSHIFSYVPSNAIKDILTHHNPERRRVKWIVVFLEYDL